MQNNNNAGRNTPAKSTRLKPLTLHVELLSHTGGELISALAAKLCYSDSGITDLKEKISSSDQKSFLQKINDLGHYSVFEHLSFTFGIEGVSRALTHQLVRHRVASYSQKSQRYVKHGNGFGYIVPETVKANPEAEEKFHAAMKAMADYYDSLAVMGIPAEDARYVLPNACETKIIVTMNARELLHFFKIRTCERAQWEIKHMAVEMLKKVAPLAPSIFANAGPSCVSGACAEGKMTCGKASEIRHFFKELTTN